jgi:DNA processing protein
MDDEKIFYNAVAIALKGNPAGVRGWKQRMQKMNGGEFGGWRSAYENLLRDNTNVRIHKRDDMVRPPHPENEWKKLERSSLRLIFREDDDFPPLLREIHHAPLAIYVRGANDRLIPEVLLKGKTIAAVGTRRATPEGKAITQRFTRELADAGFAIISGLALGIDAAAHEGCLDSPQGITVAVLAGGLDRYYPTENEWLGRKILERGGMVISEYPLGEPPYPDRFLERNRIVCGLAKGVLVVECPKRSGSLATASYAREQNRDLFVVPGSVTHPNFFGSHQLIRQGAELVTSSEDIFVSYGITKKDRAERNVANTTEEEKQVLLALHAAAIPLDVDKIIELTKLEPRIASQTVSFLLVKQLVKETETGYIIE